MIVDPFFQRNSDLYWNRCWFCHGFQACCIFTTTWDKLTVQLNKGSLVFMYNCGDLSTTLDTNVLISWVMFWINWSNDWQNFCSCTSIFIIYPQRCLRCKSRKMTLGRHLNTFLGTHSHHTTMFFEKKKIKIKIIHQGLYS